MNPRIHFRISELPVVSNFFIVPFPAGLGSIFKPPENNPNNSCKRGDGGLKHNLLLRELTEERNYLGQCGLWLVTGNQRGHGNHGSQ
jgi:hypothetical protein